MWDTPAGERPLFIIALEKYQAQRTKTFTISIAGLCVCFPLLSAESSFSQVQEKTRQAGKDVRLMNFFLCATSDAFSMERWSAPSTSTMKGDTYQVVKTSIPFIVVAFHHISIMLHAGHTPLYFWDTCLLKWPKMRL